MSIQERFCNPISESELKRRWTAVRVAMNSNKLDALVVQGAHNLAGNGGYVRWFSGLSAPTTTTMDASSATMVRTSESEGPCFVTSSVIRYRLCYLVLGFCYLRSLRRDVVCTISLPAP